MQTIQYWIWVPVQTSKLIKGIQVKVDPDPNTYVGYVIVCTDPAYFNKQKKLYKSGFLLFCVTFMNFYL
jgi:hypothetical protein